MSESILIHYADLSLKGRNKKIFVNKLRSNISELTGLSLDLINPTCGQLMISHKLTPKLKRKFKQIPGIANFSSVRVIKPNLNDIQSLAPTLINREKKDFAVRAIRSDKSLPFTSQDLNQQVGKAIVDQTGLKVNLTNPSQTLYIKIDSKYAYLYSKKINGIGGLPVGTAGDLLSLISGGIDSPVASHKMITRGARISLIHFHAYPHTTPDSINKVKTMTKTLTQYHGPIDLYLAPLLGIQEAIVKHCDSRYRITLYRRFMVKLATAVAEKNNIKGLVTGESLGQVASQTLEGLVVTTDATDLPIFRPLIGTGKQEIINYAQKIDTYATSILPDQDCCTLFTPKNPIIKPSLSSVLAQEKLLPENLIEDSLSRIQKTTITP